MKRTRIFALLLSALLLLSLLAGCGTTVVVSPEGDKGDKPAASAAPDKTGAPETQPAPDGAAVPVKTGLAVLPSVSSSKDASAEGDGTAQSEILLVAVTVGDDGVTLPEYELTETTATGTVNLNNLGIENVYGTQMPETGGMGTKLLYIAGAVLVVGAVVFLVARKRSDDEDDDE